MENAFHHKKTGVTFPICLGKRSVHNFSHSVNMAATLKGKLSDSFTNYNYVGNTKVSVSIKKT